MLLGILYVRLGNYHIASQMFKKSTIDVAEFQSAHNKIPPLQLVSRLINFGFAALLHVFSQREPEIEELNRVKTHFYDLEQRVRDASLLSNYLYLIKILLEIEADEMGRAEDHLKRFWDRPPRRPGDWEHRNSRDEQPALQPLSTSLLLVPSPYLIQQLFYYATARLLMKEANVGPRMTRIPRAVRALKYYCASLQDTPLLCPFFARRGLRDADFTLARLSRLFHDYRMEEPLEIREVRGFVRSLQRRISPNRHLRFKFLVQVESAAPGIVKRRGRMLQILTNLVKKLGNACTVSLVLLVAGDYAQKFEELKLEKYRDNILLALDELFKPPRSPEHRPQQERLLRSGANRDTAAQLPQIRHGDDLHQLEKAFVGSLQKSIMFDDPEPQQWLVLLVAGASLHGLSIPDY